MIDLFFKSPGMMFLAGSTIVVHVVAFVWIRKKIRAAIKKDAAAAQAAEDAAAPSDPPPPTDPT